MNAGHEQRDADVVSLFLIGACVLLAAALVCFGVWGLMHFLIGREAARTPAPSAQTAGAFPSPRLEALPGIELKKVRAVEEARLNSYGWIDRDARIAHIPIERAIDLIIVRGLPDVGAGQTRLQLMQARSQQNGAPRPETK